MPRSGRQASSSFCSSAVSLGRAGMFCTPSVPSSTGEAKNSAWSLKRGDSTKVHSLTPFSPLRALRRLSVKTAAA